MDLAIAGALSGAGNAGTAALQQLGNFAGQSFLQTERDKLETARLQLQEQYAQERQQAGFGHETGLLAQREAGEESRLSRKIAADEANTGMQITSSEAMKEADRASAERIHGAERTSKEGMASAELSSKERLAKQELDMKGKYYDALSQYYGKRGEAAGKSGSGETAVDKKQKEYLESVIKPMIDNLSKQLELAGPDEKAEIQERLDHVVQEARRVAGVGEPEAPTPGQIKDRFAKPPGAGGR